MMFLSAGTILGYVSLLQGPHPLLTGGGAGLIGGGSGETGTLPEGSAWFPAPATHPPRYSHPTPSPRSDLCSGYFQTPRIPSPPPPPPQIRPTFRHPHPSDSSLPNAKIPDWLTLAERPRPRSADWSMIAEWPRIQSADWLRFGEWPRPQSADWLRFAEWAVAC